MKLTDFDYNLPRDLIAQEPIRLRLYRSILIFSIIKSNMKYETLRI